MNHTPYTVCNDKEIGDLINRHMEQIVRKVLELVPEKDVSAVILGGGYGRGEGGIKIDGGKKSLYNDYDMFIVSNNISRSKKVKYHKILNDELEPFSKEIGIDVDFGPLKNRCELSHVPFTMMYYELRNGHKVVYGNPDVLSSLPDFRGENMPAGEACRLMLNRGVGLLLAGNRLEEKSDDLEFIERNIYKAVMAAGDTLMIEQKCYHFSYVKRLSMAEKISDTPIFRKHSFLDLYRSSIEYKLKPVHDYEKLQELYLKVKEIYADFYLNAFSGLLGAPVKNWNDLISGLISSKQDERSIERSLKNIILNAAKVKNLLPLTLLLKHPRVRLYGALPYFLYKDEVIHKRVYELLGLSGNNDYSTSYNKFIDLWARFN